MVVLFIALWAGGAVFLAASAVRAVTYARMPAHLRWEVYPMPERDARGRRFVQELRFMLPEMFLLKGLREWNRPLWYRSFAFHAGLYLLATAGAMVVATAIITLSAPNEIAAAFSGLAHEVYRPVGFIGAALAVAGAAGLLLRRLTDPGVRQVSVPADFLNLLFFIVAIALVVVGYLSADARFPGVVGFVRAWLRFDTAVRVPALLAAGLVSSACLLAYIPLTHMAHFIAKYFAYHHVRWDDRPSVAGSRLEHRIAASLAMRPTWAAPHVAADGKKTWTQVATTDPAGGTR